MKQFLSKIDRLPQRIQFLLFMVLFLVIVSGTFFGLQISYDAMHAPQHAAVNVPESNTKATTGNQSQTATGSTSKTAGSSTKPSTSKTSTTTKTTTGTTTHDSTKTTGGGTKSSGGTTAASMKLAIPTYWFPPSPYDTQLLSAASHIGFAIANVNSGPGASTKGNFQTMFNNEEAAGIKVYGYVYTNYGSRSLATVENDIDGWYDNYKMDGILIDEVPGTDWTSTQKSYYQSIYNYVKGKSGSSVLGTTVVLNPGTTTDQYVMSVSDVVSDYEDVESHYAGVTPPSWVNQYRASRFMNVVYDSAGVSEMQADIALARSRNVGYIDVTTATGGNPYDQLPSNPFWTDEINAL